RCALVLVRPAPVVEAALAGEQLRIPIRIVVEHQQSLAAHVDAFEVVPAILRGFDAVADEDDLTVADSDRRVVTTADGDEIAGVHGHRLSPTRKRPATRNGGPHTDQRERLFPAPLA